MLKKSLAAAALGLALLSGCSDSKDDVAAAANAMVSSSTFELHGLDGQTYDVVKEGGNFTLEGHEDKVVLFSIFGTWCPPCRAEAPHLANLQAKYADRLTVLGVAVDVDRPDADIAAFRETYGADYRLLNGEENQELSRAIAASLNIGSNFPIPLMAMYYKGRYVTHYMGAIPEEMIESDLKIALGL